MTTLHQKTAPNSTAEHTQVARIGAALDKHRGWIPVPFLGIPLLVPARTSAFLWTVGLGLIVLGEAWRLAGIAASGATARQRSRNVQRLITYGVFGWTRNPLYNGNFLIWVGVTVLSGVLWFLPIVVLLFAIEYSFIVRYEEEVLQSIFGHDYLAYKRRTPRWIPRAPTATIVGDYGWAQAWQSERNTLLQYVLLLVAFVLKTRLGQ
jgi:protein-S-isoprenylcysteine O-methyltransferase Ste14